MDSLKPGSYEHFITSFEEQCEILDKEGTPLHDLSKRDLLVGNISHQEYGTLKAEFQVKKHEYSQCVDMLMALSQQVEKSESGNVQKNIRNTKNRNGNNLKIMGYEVQENGTLPFKQYKSLFMKERKEFNLERERLRKYGKFKGSSKPKAKEKDHKVDLEAIRKSLIANLTSSIGDVKTPETKTTEKDNKESTSKLNLTSKELAIIAKVMSGGKVEIKTVKTIPSNIKVMNLEMEPSDGKYTAIVDGGADTTLAGKGFLFLEYTERSANVVGFENGMTVPDLCIGTIVTAVDDINGYTIILVFNESIDYTQQANSMISVNQIRHNGIDVDDCPKAFTVSGIQGRQSMIVGDYEIPFGINNGLIGLTCQEPTKRDLQTYPVMNVTADFPWDPFKMNEGIPQMTNLTSWDPMICLHNDRDLGNGDAWNILSHRIEQGDTLVNKVNMSKPLDNKTIETT